MFEGEIRVGFNFAVDVVELDDFDSVVVVFEETSDGESVGFVTTDTPVHCINVPWGFVGVDL